jgi:hypothetical protein
MANPINDTNYTPVNTDEDLDENAGLRKGDAETGATIGGIGGATVGAIAGAAAGPIGALAGAVIGGVAGALGSGAAVSAVDRVDNDGSEPGDTVNRGVAGTTYDLDADDRTVYDANGSVMPGNGVPGVQTGGHAIDGTPDTRGVMEKTADVVTGDRIDDKTGRPVVGTAGVYNTTASSTTYNTDVDGNVGANRMEGLGESVPSVKTGGYANDGTPDTRGVMEKTADVVTGDDIDDKTGRRVNHP